MGSSLCALASKTVRTRRSVVKSGNFTFEMGGREGGGFFVATGASSGRAPGGG